MGTGTLSGASTWTFTLRKNAAGTALTCAIGSGSGTPPVCSYTSSTVSIAANDKLDMAVQGANTPGATDMLICTFEVYL
jgi:hypothetical protein